MANTHECKVAQLAGEPLVRFGRRAMACQFEILLPARSAVQIERAAEALDVVDTAENELSVYRAESTLSRLNRTAALRPFAAPEPLFALLDRCKYWHENTDGAFDVTVGPLVHCWGFYRRQGRVPTPAELAASLGFVGMVRVRLNPLVQSVQFAQEGMEINLGAVGKGFALDAAKQHLAAVAEPVGLLHGGYSSVLGCGSVDGDGDGWPVGIRHPLRPGKRLATLRLCDQGLATSGSGEQFFRHDGRRYGHLLDPRSGRPVEGMLSATALAPTAAEADALATAFFVLGVEKTLQYCENHPEVSALLVPEPTRGGPLEVVEVGSGLHDLQLLEND